MLRLCAAIANGGAAVTPTLAYGGVGGGTVLMDTETAEYTGECMSYDVAYGYGRDRFPGLDLGAEKRARRRSATARRDAGSLGICAPARRWHLR